MKDVIQYKGFIGSVHYSSDDECFFGKIEGINDLVTFEGQDVAALKQEFFAAVDDYLDLCKMTGKPVHKTFKGSFNIRIPPSLHKKAAEKSLILGISLNQFVQNAIEKQVHEKKELFQLKKNRSD